MSAEQAARSLNQRGNKPVLQEALDAELASKVDDPGDLDGSQGNELADVSFQDESESKEVDEPDEDEPHYDGKKVQLSWYNEDLKLIINKENFYSATLNNLEGFGYMWAGVRATYGYEKGKLFYQVKISERSLSPALMDEPKPHALRVGWSVMGGLQLGEEPLSWGYDSSGKRFSDFLSTDYGKPYNRGDIVTCYLDFEASPVVISFAVNGENLGVAYKVDPEKIKGRPLFPHVLSKNCTFHVNFGEEAEQEPWAPAEESFTFVGRVPIEDNILGPVKPASRADCEMIIIMEPPGADKTPWAQKFASENKEKLYNILSKYALLDRMKVMGVPMILGMHICSGQLDELIAMANFCVNVAQTLANNNNNNNFRHRDDIIYPADVIASAQKRRIKGFEDFKQKAVVVVPMDIQFKEDIEPEENEPFFAGPAISEMKDKEDLELVECVALQRMDGEEAALLKEYTDIIYKLYLEDKGASYETKPTQADKLEDDGRKKGRYNNRRQCGCGDVGGGFRDRSSGGNRGVRKGGRQNRGNGRRGDRGGRRHNKSGGGGRRKANRRGRGRGKDRGGDRDKRFSGGNWNNLRQGYQACQAFQAYQAYQAYQGQPMGQPMGQGTYSGWLGQPGWGNHAQWANWNQQYYNQGWNQHGFESALNRQPPLGPPTTHWSL